MKEKTRLETAVEEESLLLQQAQEAHEKVDKALKYMESLETEENKGCVTTRYNFLHMAVNDIYWEMVLTISEMIVHHKHCR